MNPQTLLIIAKELRHEADTYTHPNREDLAWAAGLFDGEGYVATRTYPRKLRGQNLSCVLSVGQKDRQVLDRFAAILGRPERVRADPRNDRDAYFVFSLTNWVDVQAAIARLWWWLSPVKRAQAVRALARYKELWHPSPTFKLTAGLASEIRTRYKVERITQRELAIEYGVSQSIIHRVIRGRVFKDVPPSPPISSKLNAFADHLEAEVLGQ